MVASVVFAVSQGGAAGWTSPLMTGLAIAPQGIVGFVAGLTGARLGLQRLLVLTNAVATAG